MAIGRDVGPTSKRFVFCRLRRKKGAPGGSDVLIDRARMRPASTDKVSISQHLRKVHVRLSRFPFSILAGCLATRWTSPKKIPAGAAPMHQVSNFDPNG